MARNHHQIDRTFALMNDLRHRMDRMFEDFDTFAPPRGQLRSGFDGAPRLAASGPRIHLFDSGEALIVKADLPGVADKDLQISLNQDVLTLAAERKNDVPEGYSTHRQERPAVRFSRSFTLPSKVDASTATASLKNGVLTLTLPKAPEAQPRKITVSS
ncbi:Hsp20/alpha crystallin family protein [Chondromyces crocatus]|uniref:Heat-shock protein Hsp20 n=1 Tax=Chondromyces crocatus TaxID=52 RepID=A0A0K1E8U9_CHOCO|nr:Hsp20/alpha crystallin family protein [Chondromyces crocatus]AKT37306.1 heat-shock protein Hsp20 [Chondromyces crocatus]